MQYNNLATTRLGLVEDTLYLCGLPTVSASYASYALVDITRNINNAYLNVVRNIWNCAAGWQYDDSNQTTLPVGYTTLVHNQQDYTLPSTAQRVQRIEVKDSDGNFQLLSQIDIHDIDKQAMSEFQETASMPVYYDIVGRSIMLYPTPSSASVTTVSGLAVYVDREPDLFTSGSTTTEPGFASPFHRILSYSATLDFEEDPQRRALLLREKERLEQGLTQFYSRRNIERKANIRLAKNWRQYK